MGKSLKTKALFAIFAAAALPLEALLQPIEEGEQEGSVAQSACGAIEELNNKDFEDNNGPRTSYVGTTTGPGPNGGYAATPRGTHRVETKNYFYSDRDN